MGDNSNNHSEKKSRRDFFKLGAGLFTGAFATKTMANTQNEKKSEEQENEIIRYKELGRTGFEASDIGMGGTRFKHPNIARYAYDHGVNYFDTAEGYLDGQSEKNLGKALKHMKRDEVFITTKLGIGKDESKDSIIQRFTKCQERLDTEYVDALYMHGVTEKELLDQEGFHSATKKLKQEGRLKYIGLSSHGPHNEKQDSMKEVLCAAAEDGRFDLMLLVYNFMNKDAGNEILKACKKNNVGTTAMKTSPGVLNFESVDPNNLSKSQKRIVDRLQNVKGYSRQRAINSMKNTINNKDKVKKIKKFANKYELDSQLEFHKTSIKWVISNPDLHSACISFNNFQQLKALLPISGVTLSYLEKKSLEEYQNLFDSEYCRHGCKECFPECPQNVPVSRIMRFAYYFQGQNREKESMVKYNDLEKTAEYCSTCTAPCTAACPHDFNIPANMIKAHNLLSLV